jgi:signal transduction histidine kinase
MQQQSLIQCQNVNYKKIYASALKLLYQLTPEQTYETIVEEAKKLIKAKYGTIILFQNNNLKRVYASSPLIYEVTPRKKGKTFKVYKNQEPYLLSQKKLFQLHPEFKKLNVGSDMGVPLTFSNKTYGVLSLFSYEKTPFTNDDLAILQLFSSVASLAIRNMQLYSDIKKSLADRDLFIALAAHELKTPLTSISIYSQLLLQREVGTNIKIKLFTEVTRLKNLINELLQINQIKTGQLQFIFQKCDFSSVIENAITVFKNMHDHPIKFKKLVKTKYTYINGDFDKLLQVITNLLNNAAKFSSPTSPITISLAYHESSYILSIADKGVGMQKKELLKIFDQFYKGSSQQTPGLGLGLFLVKNIIDYHKGKIHVTSKLHKGTTFSIALPMYNDG